MKKLLTLTLLSLPAFAQTMRVPSGGFCDITTVSTSGVITYAADGSCAPVEGQVIFITGVRAGNNMHPVNSRPDTNHRYRKIKAGTLNTGARTFQVTDMADTDVANTPPGGGSALSGTLGMFGAMSSAYTIRPEKGGFLNGPAGDKTTALASSSRKAGAAYTALGNIATAYKTWRTTTYPDAWGGIDYLFTERHSATLAVILKYLADSSDTTARDVAIADLKVPSPAIGTASCTEAMNNCGLPATSYADYSPSNFALWQALAATYVDGETGWGSADRERLSRLWLNDNCWYEGGLADTTHCPGQSPGPYNKLDWKIHNTAGTPDYTHGTTPTTASGNTTVTITGGDLIVDGVAVGDIIFFPHPSESGGAQAYKIASLTATSVTLTVPLRSGLTSGQHFAVGYDWTSADMGMAFQRMHFGAGYQYGCGTCFYYPPEYNGNLDASHNLPLVRMMGEMATGMYACGSHSDQIGCYAAERATFWYYHIMLREVLKTNSNGFNSTKFFYNEWRLNAAHGMIITMMRNWLSGGPDWNYGTMLEGNSSQWRHMYYPGRGIGPWMPFTADYTANYFMSPMFNMHNNPAGVEAGYAQDHIQNVMGTYTSGMIGYNSGSYAHWHYLMYNPDITATAAPTGAIGRSYIPECLTIWSADQCEDIGRTVVSSRTGWTLSDSIGQLVAGSISAADQVDQNGTGQVTLIKNNIPLIWGDASTGYGGASTGLGSTLAIDGGMLANSYPNAGTVTVPWQSLGTNHTYARTVMNAAYSSGAGVTLAERQWARVGSVYFVHDRGTTSSAKSYRSRYHPAINSCGTVTSATCVTVDLASRSLTSAYPSGSPTAGLHLIAVPLAGGTIAMVKESGTAGNLSYTGGAGLSGRVEICPSSDGTTCTTATSYEAAVVLVPTTGSGSAPAVATSTAGSHRVIEVAAPYAAVMALTAGGATATSLTFTTAHSGSAPYVVAGLDAGTYNVTRNGTAVSGSPFTVTSSEGSLAFSTASGTIAIASTTAPPTITTTSLPDGAIGTSYSQTLAASGGTPAYAWDLSTGSLPPGLSLNASSGAITGTPTTAGTYNFTARVTDADTNTDTQALSITIPTLPGPGYRLVLRQGVLLR